ncbi:MAG: DUF559 domain-containing protein [Candidatus Peribacteraceae bacterium]|jgi:very-short-patch-repair endonuclease
MERHRWLLDGQNHVLAELFLVVGISYDEEGSYGMHMFHRISKRLRKTQKLAHRLRRMQTKSEKVLWEALRNRRLCGLKFRRQVNIGKYVVDFYCAEHALIVEVDGSIHWRKGERDFNRQRSLEWDGYRFLRIPSADVENCLGYVLKRIRSAVRRDRNTYIPSPAQAGEG